MRVFAFISLFALSCAAFGQSAEKLPAFDVVDVHPSAKSTNPNMTGGVLRAGRYDLRKATMVDLIRTAYGVDFDKVVGGPSWLETDRFDMVAKAPAATPPETVKLMLQTMLADRFQLVVHKDTLPRQGYALTVAKGKAKMKEAASSGNSGCLGKPDPPLPAQVVHLLVACRGVTMEVFAQNMRQIGGPYLSSPVVDRTGLTGVWDIDLKFTPRPLLANAGPDSINFFDALESQLGLKLDLQTIPTPVIVVDSVNRKPTANPAGIQSSLPTPPPAEFEVADIKPSMPGAAQNARIQNGRVDAQALSLKTLVTIAWEINSDDLIVAPKWMESANFDIVAKVTTAPAAANAPQVDIDDLRAMLRSLLIDRFRMKVHLEDRPVPAYTLTAVKPKLVKADPLNRTGCKEGPGADGKDPRVANPILSRLISCQNMSLSQLADLLPNLANGYVQTPVLDATGLDGAYDFTLSFSAIGLVRNGGRGGDNPGAIASDPNGALSLPDAVNKQLGLKLELQKRTMPVLIVDHAEEKPTEN